MSYIKRKRDRRAHEAKRVIEAQAIWRPRHFIDLNREAIEEELTISNDRIWAMPDHPTLTFNMPVWGRP